MRGSDRPHTSIVAAGRTPPKHRRNDGQHGAKSSRSSSGYRTRTTSAKEQPASASDRPDRLLAVIARHLGEYRKDLWPRDPAQYHDRGLANGYLGVGGGRGEALQEGGIGLLALATTDLA
jgi:hypothetical protein